MLVTLELPFADVRAADLALALDGPDEQALEVLTLEAAGYRAELRLLGCSHQALVDTGTERLSELVACRPGGRSPLPERASESRGTVRYEFRARTDGHEPDCYRDQAAEIVERIAADRFGLVGRFPGPAHQRR